MKILYYVYFIKHVEGYPNAMHIVASPVMVQLKSFIAKRVKRHV